MSDGPLFNGEQYLAPPYFVIADEERKRVLTICDEHNPIADVLLVDLEVADDPVKGINPVLRTTAEFLCQAGNNHERLLAACRTALAWSEGWITGDEAVSVSKQLLNLEEVVAPALREAIAATEPANRCAHCGDWWAAGRDKRWKFCPTCGGKL